MKMSDKERLEQIQQNDLIQAISDGFLFGKDGLETENIFRDVEWLIKQAERVQELESELNKQIEIGYKFEGEVYDLAKENKRYRKALEFYAGGNHYSDKLYDDKIILLDDGEIARKVLEG